MSDHQDRALKTRVFLDRADAGKKLGRKLLEYRSSGAVALAIPMGGIPVAYQVASRLQAELGLVIPRKLPIPWSPEAAFGAVTIDGGVALNRELVEGMGITRRQMEVVTELVISEIRRQTMYLLGDRPEPEIRGRTTLVVDDGLASGYTMLAAIGYVRSLGPSQVIAAAPVSSVQAARLVEKEADKLVTLTVSARIPFAIADFYLDRHELSEDEVKEYLKASTRATTSGR